MIMLTGVIPHQLNFGQGKPDNKEKSYILIVIFL